MMGSLKFVYINLQNPEGLSRPLNCASSQSSTNTPHTLNYATAPTAV